MHVAPLRLVDQATADGDDCRMVPEYIYAPPDFGSRSGLQLGVELRRSLWR